MQDRARSIFGNPMPEKTIKKAERKKRKFLKKFGDDSGAEYTFQKRSQTVLSELGATQLVKGESAAFSEKDILIGNIRMGFGHYRISMAMASAANALGYRPVWFDLASFPDSACSKIITSQNKLYSMGSRLADKFRLFNKFYWEPLNSEGFRKLSYNACDQKTAEIMANLLRGLPKGIPFLATHTWCAQAAVHAGFERVVNAVPDNWPMALHLAEGAVHTVQTQSAFLGYKALRGMDESRSLSPMPKGSVVYTGHYVDHELIQNLEEDTAKRKSRIASGKAKRFLITVGGAGAQKEIFSHVIKTLLPDTKSGKATLFLNVGDHLDVWEKLKKDVPALENARLFLNDYEGASAFARHALDHDVNGIYAFCNSDIFAAVYLTNLLMRASDVLVTKPSELSFYPVPKLFIHRVGGHEAYGAIRSSEMGDGTYECETIKETADMIGLLMSDPEVLCAMNDAILQNKEQGLYSGAYRAVELAFGKKME